MKILKYPEVFSAENIKRLEERKDAVFVCDTCLMDPNGNWINSPVAVFWNKDPANIPTGGSAWFGMFFNMDRPWEHPDYKGALYITNAISAVQHAIVGIIAENDDIIYSRYRHDYRMSPDGTAMVDGGRDYTRTGPFGKGQVELQIIEGELVVADAITAKRYRSALESSNGH